MEGPVSRWQVPPYWLLVTCQPLAKWDKNWDNKWKTFQATGDVDGVSTIINIWYAGGRQETKIRMYPWWTRTRYFDRVTIHELPAPHCSWINKVSSQYQSSFVCPCNLQVEFDPFLFSYLDKPSVEKATSHLWVCSNRSNPPVPNPAPCPRKCEANLRISGADLPGTGHGHGRARQRGAPREMTSGLHQMVQSCWIYVFFSGLWYGSACFKPRYCAVRIFNVV